MKIDGAWVFEPRLFPDDRGSFHEWFQAPDFERATGHRLNLAQANCSVSDARHAARHPLRRRTARPGQIRQMCPRRRARRRGRHPRRLADVRPVGLGAARRRHAPRDLPQRGPRARVHGADRRRDADLPVLRGLRTGARAHVHPLDPTLAIEWPLDVEPMLSEPRRRRADACPRPGRRVCSRRTTNAGATSACAAGA